MLDPDVSNTVVVMAIVSLLVWVIGIIPRYIRDTTAAKKCERGEAVIVDLAKLSLVPFRELLEEFLQYDASIASYHRLPFALSQPRIHLTEDVEEISFCVAHGRGFNGDVSARVLMGATFDDLKTFLRGSVQRSPTDHRASSSNSSDRNPSGPLSPLAGVSRNSSTFDLRRIGSAAQLRGRSSASTSVSQSVGMVSPASSADGLEVEGVELQPVASLEIDTAQSSTTLPPVKFISGANSSGHSDIDAPLDLTASRRRSRPARLTSVSSFDEFAGDREPELTRQATSDISFSHPLCSEQLMLMTNSHPDVAPISFILQGECVQAAGWPRAHSDDVVLVYCGSVIDSTMRNLPRGAADANVARIGRKESDDAEPPRRGLTLQMTLKYICISSSKIIAVSEVFTEGEATRGDDDGSGTDAEPDCIVCYTNPRCVITVPCGHFCICNVCVRRVSDCPVCRKPITGVFTLLDDANGSPMTPGPPSVTEIYRRRSETIVVSPPPATYEPPASFSQV